MWWHDKGMDRPVGSAHGRIMRAAAALVIAALAGGWFPPLYGEQAPTGGASFWGPTPARQGPQVWAPPGTPQAGNAGAGRKHAPFQLTPSRGGPPPTPRH